ncbi:MAG: hypothetical protein F6K62_11245 [Sphaerospermopsis sp. SIO1G2]|nr:hypothetical protein [Sphaerospermopsis sp. SIO1G2]
MTFQPQAGLVIRYDYLWKSEHDAGRIDGAKDRPCAIVLATKDKGGGKRSLLLCAITHSPPNQEEKAIEIPLKVAHHLGLDHDRMWIKTHEVNIVEWQEGRIV